MTDKKMIEEMAKDITEIEFPENVVVTTREMYDELYKKANLYEYQKENAVVIPEKITEETSPEDIIKIAKYNETIRKETAREIIDELYNIRDYYGESLEYEIRIGAEGLKELAKQYGVEVEE